MKRTYKIGNITVVEVEDAEDGVESGFLLLSKLVDERSILFLSGGSTPEPLYRKLAEDHKYKIKPRAVATTDERWGPPGHENSNEEMIRNTGLYDHFKKDKEIEIHTILHGILNRKETADRYNTVIEGIFERLRNSTAIMGVGADGHTAGLAPGIKKWQETNKYVIDFKYENPEWKYPERITLTPLGLSQIKNYIILSFGEEKKQALNKIFAPDNKIIKHPAALFKNLQGSVFLVTDQKLDSAR